MSPVTLGRRSYSAVPERLHRKGSERDSLPDHGDFLYVRSFSEEMVTARFSAYRYIVRRTPEPTRHGEWPEIRPEFLERINQVSVDVRPFAFGKIAMAVEIPHGPVIT